MNRLLREELFDQYDVRSVEIDLMTRVDVSGALVADAQVAEAQVADARAAEAQAAGTQIAKAQVAEAQRRFASWAELRPLIYAIIKSSARPRGMKVVFSCDAETNNRIHANALALFLNVHYINGGVHFTTATAQREFILDKTLDTDWDAYVTAFFKQSGVQIKMLT